MGEGECPLSADKGFALLATSLGSRLLTLVTYSTAAKNGGQGSRRLLGMLGATAHLRSSYSSSGIDPGAHEVEEYLNEYNIGKVHDIMDQIPGPNGDRILVKLDMELQDHVFTLVEGQLLQKWKSKGGSSCLGLSNKKKSIIGVGILPVSNPSSMLSETIYVKTAGKTVGNGRNGG
ncbi:hypothetical protein CONLIGDRAFT_645543 [Coniochaeta ligniaria NRRL 30616]|uniref:Uncharacterized protein n=1 Tax=Coniochaeta ligniaria NRRL 30616 TaxID=1408157 RepID=A0A1J7JBW8_9PEZI|nr:hypothetical protein CONLIGDRAFT_645543 [Coniochaeta ligniaria NRRL 30616]